MSGTRIAAVPENPTPFACDLCNASYRLPQHLGLHRYHKHGIQGQKTAKAIAGRKKLSRVPDEPKRTYVRRLTAEEVCLTVLKEVAPRGGIPVGALTAYGEWVKATEVFLTALRQKGES